ncbi:hypothetical protein CcaverHIS641_0508130 [Cutaneotrichosporon cavernicola]|nr:hypothetical protein CcaverHIS641_0508130 [Cutaneotrichosporon cavernicola]
MSQAPAPSPLPLPPDASASPRAPRAPFAFSPYSSSPPSSSLPPSSTASPRRSPTKRRLVLRAGPETFVASESRLDGTLSLGTGCVIHPKATVIAAAGASIFLGDGVVIEEMAEVLFRGPGRATIGSGTVVMVGAVVDLVPDSPEGSRAVGEWFNKARDEAPGVQTQR